MSKITGFLEIDRRDRKYTTASDRIRHWNEFLIPLSNDSVEEQSTRCMDCGIPYCHSGCPINNQIPDFNNLIHLKDWEAASKNLHSTNNFPEFTGRVCPAPCEAACTLNLYDSPVTIKTIECAIVDKAWQEGWIVPEIASYKINQSIAIIGSGPAGLSAAQQLARYGYQVNVYEKNAKPGGLLRYGIPDFKLEKSHIDKRIKQMEAEGVVFWCNHEVGNTISIEEIKRNHDCIIIAIGSEKPRDLLIPGRELNGIFFAMDFLTEQNRKNSNEYSEKIYISAMNKRVVVIGGGDTGSDCIGTAIRQGALSITQLEILPQPPKLENKLTTWPNWPLKLRTSSSLEEGASREFSVRTKEFRGENGSLNSILCEKIDKDFNSIPGSDFIIEADMAFLALGFVSPLSERILNSLELETDPRGNIKTDPNTLETNIENIFACGDTRRGQSLVVWAINEGRRVAENIHKKLQNK